MLSLCFYKDPGNFMNWGIRLVTRSKYSHCELLFSDGVSISSSSRDGGVRAKTIDFSDGKWDIVRLFWFAKDEGEVRKWAEAQIGRKYDWSGIFGFIIKPVHENDQRMFCSEFCALALGFSPELAAKMSPGALYSYVKYLFKK